MPLQVNIHEAKTHLSKLLVKVKEGQEVIIAKNGKPVARLVPVLEKPVQRVPGTAAGKVFIAADFTAPLAADLLDDFEQ